MPRRRKRTRADARVHSNAPETARPVEPSAPGVSVNQKGPSLPAMLRITLETAADMAKKELGSKGRIVPMAVFGYHRDPDRGEGGGAFKVVSLVWRTELQKEAIRRRIREKAAAEGATALVVLARADREGAGSRQKNSPEQKGVLVFSGAMPEATASARVAYVLQRETKTFTSWEMRISAEPQESFFLDGVFVPPNTAR